MARALHARMAQNTHKTELMFMFKKITLGRFLV